jgi:hypothetical protein
MRLLLVCCAIALCSCVVTQAVNINLDTKSANDACRASLSSPSLDSIRDKVTLFRLAKDGPPPAAMSSNVSLPTDDELRAIGKWTQLRSDCEHRQDAALRVPASASPRLAEQLNYEITGFRAVRAAVDGYIALLGARKVSYGEFEQRHYELVHAAGALQQQLFHAYMHHDQAEQDAVESRFTALLREWDAYMASVANRAPQSPTPPAVGKDALDLYRLGVAQGT